jgi:uncharacterized protein (DUF608 family)
MQSAEMWLGTTYSLAAGMLQEDLVDEAFTTARGAYLAVYQDYGLWFRTPEAITLAGVHRAVGYMRPLAIWAMQWAVIFAAPATRLSGYKVSGLPGDTILPDS